MRVVVIEPPLPAVTYEEAARHLRLDGDDEREYVEALIAVAQSHIDGAEGWLGRAIGVQTLEVRCEHWPSSLPFRPISSIVSVSVDGAPVDGIGVEPDGVLIVPPRVARPAKEMSIRYLAGSETAPAPIRHAILLMVGDLYANRETTSERPRGSIDMSVTVERLLAPYRIWSL